MMVFFRAAAVALGLSAALLPTLSHAEPAIRYPSGKIGNTSAFKEVTPEGLPPEALPFVTLTEGHSLAFSTRSVVGDDVIIADMTITADKSDAGAPVVRVEETNRQASHGASVQQEHYRDTIPLAHGVPVIIEDHRGNPVAAVVTTATAAQQIVGG